MDNIKYEGHLKMHPFKCSTCGQSSTHKYLRRPHQAVRKLLEDTSWKEICRKCAKKEVGTKNKRGWDKLHADA
tara:strand:- start:681 stop:899 length:219 start_codon:yes stop_codon:yes gene_type:complete